MNKLVFLPAAVALAAGCHDDPITPLADPVSQPLAASVANSSAYEAIDVGTLGSPISELGVLTRHGVVFGFSQDANGGNHEFRWDGALSDVGVLPPRSFRMARAAIRRSSS